MQLTQEHLLLSQQVLMQKQKRVQSHAELERLITKNKGKKLPIIPECDYKSLVKIPYSKENTKTNGTQTEVKRSIVV